VFCASAHTVLLTVVLNRVSRQGEEARAFAKDDDGLGEIPTAVV